MSQGFTRPYASPVPIASGGTGSSTAPGALVNLGLGTPTGTGNVVLQTAPTINQPVIMGVTTNSTASAGSVGEIISSVVLVGSAVNSPGSGSAFNITLLSLTAGDWNVYGEVWVGGTAGAGIIGVIGGISLTSATVPSVPSVNNAVVSSGSFSGMTFTVGSSVMPIYTLDSARIGLGSTTNVYLTCVLYTSSGTGSGYGKLVATRLR